MSWNYKDLECLNQILFFKYGLKVSLKIVEKNFNFLFFHGQNFLVVIYAMLLSF